MDEATKQMFDRIKKAEPDFVGFLKEEQQALFRSFLRSQPETNEWHKGAASTLEKLILKLV